MNLVAAQLVARATGREHVEQHGGAQHSHEAGGIMAATFKLEPQLDRLLDTPGLRRLACDLAGVSFVDSAGLGLLLALRERAQGRGIAMTVVSVSAPVRRILDVSGLDAVLSEDESRHDAT